MLKLDHMLALSPVIRPLAESGLLTAGTLRQACIDARTAGKRLPKMRARTLLDRLSAMGIVAKGKLGCYTFSAEALDAAIRAATPAPEAPTVTAKAPADKSKRVRKAKAPAAGTVTPAETPAPVDLGAAAAAIPQG